MIETATSYTDGVGICSSEFPTSNIISQPQLVSVSVSSLLINQNIELWGVGFHLAMGNAISLLQIVVFNIYTQALSVLVCILQNRWYIGSVLPALLLINTNTSQLLSFTRKMFKSNFCCLHTSSCVAFLSVSLLNMSIGEDFTMVSRLK